MSEPLAPVDLVLLWHHHQPDYRRPGDGVSLLPWTRLHATKDYVDMARHVERHPGLRVTFNLVPSLVDQIEDAARGGPDELFDRLSRPIASLSPEERAAVAARCAQVPPHALDRWPALRTLRERVRAGRKPPATSPPATSPTDRDGASAPIDDRELLSLEIWFLLAWLDPMFHEAPEAARALVDAPRWNERHRDDLLALHRRLAGEVIPAYRTLAERGQIELSASPYHHPILPLLVDNASARRARPDLALPATPFAAPQDAGRQIARALVRHAEAFGVRPAGMWPSEGSVSPEVATLAAGLGVRWLASDEGVLWRSLDPGAERGALYRPWKLATDAGEVALFFRDHALSDRIGFVYQRWDARDAALDFLTQLRRIGRDHRGETPPVVSVILDGENCWEGYPEDGDRFLNELYRLLAEAEDVRTRTPSDVLADHPAIGVLPRLHSGSWIDADFHIWIGHPEKNRAWEQLARARAALVAAGTTPESAPAAWEALARAEGSDWFWWFGEDHATGDKAVFDRLFRELASAAYTGAALAPPASLRLPIVRVEDGSRQSPIGLVTPTIDGRQTSFYEWHEAGRATVDAGSSMHRGEGLVREVFYGFDAGTFYLRLDWAGGAPGEAFDLRIELVEPRPVRLRVKGLAAGERPVTLEAAGEGEHAIEGAVCRIGPVLELAVPFASLGVVHGELMAVLVQVLRDGQAMESVPGEEGITFVVPDANFEATMWSA